MLTRRRSTAGAGPYRAGQAGKEAPTSACPRRPSPQTAILRPVRLSGSCVSAAPSLRHHPKTTPDPAPQPRLGPTFTHSCLRL